jgi:hypothetical protein
MRASELVGSLTIGSAECHLCNTGSDPADGPRIVLVAGGGAFMQFQRATEMDG